MRVVLERIALVSLGAASAMLARHLMTAARRTATQQQHLNVLARSATLQRRPASSVTCAPSNNLNGAFPHFPTAKELYAHIRALSKNESKEFVVRNFVGVIEDVSVAASTVETELFPLGALEYYTKKNMGWDYSEEEVKQWQLLERGGEQGDYRAGIDRKIANAIECLKSEPLSKRATITFPFSGIGSEANDWTQQGMNKCCRELHLYLEDGKLKCTAIVRMQNANIFVKDIVRSP